MWGMWCTSARFIGKALPKCGANPLYECIIKLWFFCVSPEFFCWKYPQLADASITYRTNGHPASVRLLRAQNVYPELSVISSVTCVLLRLSLICTCTCIRSTSYVHLQVLSINFIQLQHTQFSGLTDASAVLCLLLTNLQQCCRLADVSVRSPQKF